MAEVVVVTFKKGSKPYYFGKGGLTFEKGQGVVVETSKGLEYARVADPSREVPDEEIVQPLKNVIRIANERDEAARAAQEDRRGEALSRESSGKVMAEEHQSASFSAAVFTRGRTAAKVPSSDPTRAPRAFEPGQVEVQVSFQEVVEV